MRIRTTVVLFLIALALAAYFVFVELPRGGGDTAPPAMVTTLDPDAVDRLLLQRDDATLAFERVDTHWEMTQPVRDLADASAVMRLLAAVAGARVERSIGAQEDLSPYGLDRPLIIVVEPDDAGDGTLRVGGYTVDRAFVYAQRPGEDAVLLVPTDIRRYATAAVEDYRYKRVATFDISVVDSFRVRSPAHTMSWQRGPGGWFTVAGTDTLRGDTRSVEGILRRLRALRVSGFPPPVTSYPDSAGYGVTVYRHHPAPPQRIVVSPRPSSLIVGVEPRRRVVEVDSTIMEVFAFDVSDLRDRHLLQFDGTAAARIEFTTPNVMLTLVRSGDVWNRPNPSRGSLDADRVRAALGAASALEFDRVLSEQPPAPGRLTPPTLRLAVEGADGTIMDVLVCRYAPGDSTAVATSRSSQLAAEVTVEKLHHLEERFQRIQSD